ncbi:glycoside hydrolase superfamily [Bipolaris maydis]|nr:glycoside hydrolase superfamily [Bipolaris maydis]
MKRLLINYLIFLSSFAQAASNIYTSFNYGAFWSVEANAKKKADFLDGFNLAKNLTTDIPFDSARLFTCKTAGTVDGLTEAFDAAVESSTNLLLGFWITPARSGDSPDENVKNEMAALEKGFKKHGQALSDLVIGLSVGSEDIYRSEAGELGLTAEVVGQTVAKVKESIAASPFAEYMKNKPIGHVDTAKYAVIDNADFIGMTAYPYWNKDSINTASGSFQHSLEDVKQRAGNRPVWIAEMGWPSTDTEQHGAAIAGIDELQKFWTEVGCFVFGKYTTFWYELLKDSTPDQKADWGLIDTLSRKPRIKDLSCGVPKQILPSRSTVSSSSHATLSATKMTMNRANPTITPHLATSIVKENWCVTVADVERNGQPGIVAGGPSAPGGECSSPPTFYGVSYVTSEAVVTEKPSDVPVGRAWCVTMADVDRNGQMLPVDAGPAMLVDGCNAPSMYQWKGGMAT